MGVPTALTAEFSRFALRFSFVLRYSRVRVSSIPLPKRRKTAALQDLAELARFVAQFRSRPFEAPEPCAMRGASKPRASVWSASAAAPLSED